jgi:hypothetical protein
MTREEKIQEQAKIAKREFLARFDWSGNQETGFQKGAKWADQHPSVDTIKKIVCYALKKTNILLAEDLENGVEWELLIKKAMKGE